MVKSFKRKILEHLFLTITVIAGILSCEDRERPPADILTTNEMVAVMAELYIAEQKISTLGISRDSLRQVFEVMEGPIFEKMNTSDSIFKKSLDYYMERPKTLEYIYAALIDSLNLHEQRVSTGERPQ